MAASRRSSSLYRRLLNSHMQIAGVAGLLLGVCLLVTVYFQQRSATVATVRLPESMAFAEIGNGIEASTSNLRSWVLLGTRNHAENRQQVWAEQIEPATEDLVALAGDDALASMAPLREKMEQLKDSQWWVEDMARTVGNNPALLIYERELLPIYDQLQRAVVGLNGSVTDAKISGIQLAAATTHRNLTEAVLQLTEVVRTGSIAEIKDFNDGSDAVQRMLAQLSEQIAPGDSERPLLDWILRDYHAYEQLAQHIIATRQADDWNRALYVLRTETEPLATDVKNTLVALQKDHNKLLQEDVSRNALINRVASFITMGMIFVLGMFAWLVARTNSNRIVAPIEALAIASDQLANVEDPPVQLRVEGPREIAYLTERFNHMSRELTARTKDVQHANRELQAYTHIITHDLKAPLINIKGHAGLIKTQLQELEAMVHDEKASQQSLREAVLRTVTEDIPESVKFIDLSITKTNTLVGGVLDNSRLLFRNIALEDVNMNDLVNQVVSLFSHRFHDVEFHCESLPVVRTDAFLMEHVFVNLIDNAVKYLDANRAGRIDIDGETRDGEAHFYVRDNGIGLDAAAINVFMLFAQADANNKGAGVGLALVQTMLAKLGGRIRHQSNAEHGTSFMFCVPLYHEKPD